MKKTAIALSILLPLLTSMFQFSGLVDANPMVSLPEIVIRSDGAMSPETDLITKTGNTYSLTSDLSQTYAILIQCSNTVFDGGGHIVNGTVPSPSDLGGWRSENSGLSVEGVTNVTVKDIDVTGFDDSDVT